MERAIYNKLLEWKNNVERKPLILLGARQVGKTYILKQFGAREFSNMVYVNCHNNEFMANLFTNFDISRVIYQISVHTGQKITSGKTLLFLDEIQEIHRHRGIFLWMPHQGGG